jgi:hypothetical protein
MAPHNQADTKALKRSEGNFKATNNNLLTKLVTNDLVMFPGLGVPGIGYGSHYTCLQDSDADELFFKYKN